MNRTVIIAEAGVNHNGDLKLAKQMVKTAKECGADIVKFQTAKLESLVSKSAPMAEYQKENTGRTESQMNMLKRILLPYDNFVILARYCEEVGIQFLSTPFDIDSVDFLASLGCKLWKIPSGEITNLPYLERIGRQRQPIILSTGMSTLAEIEEALNVLHGSGAGKITLLHCTTEYPAPYETVNLRAMLTLKEKFQTDVGYSDHTMGTEISVAAVAMGAAIIEKHFTLSRSMEGPDQKASLEPQEFKAMVSAIRNIELAMGDGDKKPMQSELANLAVARKSIIARKAIMKGEILTEGNITTKRPGNGVSPMKWYEVLGTRAVRDFKEDELIEL